MKELTRSRSSELIYTIINCYRTFSFAIFYTFPLLTLLALNVSIFVQPLPPRKVQAGPQLTGASKLVKYMCTFLTEICT